MSDPTPLRKVADNHAPALAKLRGVIDMIEAGELTPDVLCIVARDRRRKDVFLRVESDEPWSSVIGVLQFGVMLAYENVREE